MRTRSLLVALVAGLSVAASACGGSKEVAKGSQVGAVSPGGSRDQSKWPADDRSMCEWRGKVDVEVGETAGPGSLRPNVRRVWKTVGERDARRRTLVCREIDTNLDGIKDTARWFNAKGEAQREEVDSNYDGKIDGWLAFVGGRLAEAQEDTNHDGTADVWKFYTDGNLTRIKRDRNFDGKADIWEVYTRGHLERMGVDDSFDGHVDRWDRDQQAMMEAEAAERRARDQMSAAEAQSQGGGASAPGGDAGAASTDAGDAGGKTSADGGK